MNIKNNKLHQETEESINNAFLCLLNDKELHEVAVTDICKLALIDRSTFYDHYEDVFDLANTYAEKIEKQISGQPHTNEDFSWLFRYAKENPETFKIYFKLGVSKVSADYKTIFFRNGIYSMIKLWFEGGCVETPEQMGIIIKREYDKINSI